ncbi:MAG: hypothetical protein JWO58_3121 [Chitinophagaceae bacterium]|nr:hypothetical protein [Chitinophagaceae bacterium]
MVANFCFFAFKNASLKTCILHCKVTSHATLRLATGGIKRDSPFVPLAKHAA